MSDFWLQMASGRSHRLRGPCRVSEIVNIKIENVDFDACQIKIQEGKGKKDRIVPFPTQFKEVLKNEVRKRNIFI